MNYLNGTIRVGLGDLPGKFKHTHALDQSHWWGGGEHQVEYDSYRLALHRGVFEVYIGAHPVQQLRTGEPFEELQIDGHRGLSRRVILKKSRSRELFFLPSCWVRVFYEARTDEVAALFDEAIGALSLKVLSWYSDVSPRGQGWLRDLIQRSPGQRVLSRELAAQPGSPSSSPALESSVDALDFGQVPLGAAVSIPLQIFGDYTVEAIDCPEGFQVYDRFGSRWAADTIKLPADLRSEVLSISFRPQRPGQHTGDVRFSARGLEFLSVAVSGSAGEQRVPPFRDNESLVEFDAQPLVEIKHPTPENPMVLRMIHYTKELDFGDLSWGDQRDWSLYLRSLENRPVPVAFGGALALGRQGRGWFWLDFGAHSDRVSHSGVLWLEPKEEIHFTVHCHCRPDALLPPQGSLAIGTPSRTKGISLKFYFQGETSWKTYVGGWGFGHYSYEETGLLAQLDPELEAQIIARQPPPPPIG